MPLLAMSADCLPIAVARTATGRARSRSSTRAGAGSRKGSSQAGVAALGPGEKAAVIGPAIGPCCYEVGTEVSDRFDADLTHDGKLDLWSAAERALRAAGVGRSIASTSARATTPSSSSRTAADGRARGVQGVIGAVA